MTREQQMHRRAQKAEGAIKAALYELDLSERFFFRGSLATMPGADLHRRTIREVRKALNRAAIQASKECK